jgi:hypothetical protein
MQLRTLGTASLLRSTIELTSVRAVSDGVNVSGRFAAAILSS